MKTICRTIIFSLFCCFIIVSTATAQGLLTVQLKSFKAESRNGNVGLTWKTASEQNLAEFDVETSSDGKYYSRLGFIPATNNINGDIYEFEHPVSYADSVYFRLRIVDDHGRSLYTEPVLYYPNKITAYFVYPSVINTRVMNIFINDPFQWLEVVSMNGTVMLKENLSGKMGRINIPLSADLAAGMYIVQLSDHGRSITQKVMVQ